MKLKNVLIVVKDIERSRLFYHDLFGLETILDNDGNMILTDGLVLQEEKYWKEFLGKEILPESNSCELYFEECNIEGFVKRLEEYFPEYAAGISQEPAEGLHIAYKKAEYEVFIETPQHSYQYSKMYDDLFILDGESYFLEDEQSKWNK